MNIAIPDQYEVLEHYGADAQAMVHCEELGELIQSISKMRRAVHSGKDTHAALAGLAEEAADCLICIRQIQEMYCIGDEELQEIVERKCERQKERIHGNG